VNSPAGFAWAPPAQLRALRVGVHPLVITWLPGMAGTLPHCCELPEDLVSWLNLLLSLRPPAQVLWDGVLAGGCQPCCHAWLPILREQSTLLHPCSLGLEHED